MSFPRVMIAILCVIAVYTFLPERYLFITTIAILVGAVSLRPEFATELAKINDMLWGKSS